MQSWLQSVGATQHRVHPTGGSRRVFWQFLWLQVGSGKTVFSRPAHPQVTHPVGRTDKSLEKLWSLNIE